MNNCMIFNESTILSASALINQILSNYMIVKIVNHKIIKPEFQKWSIFCVTMHHKSKQTNHEFKKNHK